MTGLPDHRERLYANYVSAGGLDLPDRGALEGRGPYLRRVIRRHLPRQKDAMVLDLGCGHGALLHFARELGYTRVRGVDGSPEQVELARQLGIEGVAQGDVLDALRAEAPGSLDVVVAFDLLEHLDKDEILRLLDDAHRALRPEGRLLLHVPNGESPFFGRIRYGDFTHRLAFTPGSLEQILRATGFADPSFHEDRPVVHGPRSLARRVIYEALRAGIVLFLAAETGSTRFVVSQNVLVAARRPA